MAMIPLCLRKGRIITKTVLEGVHFQTDALPATFTRHFAYDPILPFTIGVILSKYDKIFQNSYAHTFLLKSSCKFKVILSFPEINICDFGAFERVIVF